MKHIGRFVEKPNPELRHTLGDVYDLGVRKHYMKALLEIDVTKAREDIRSYRRNTGEGLSFTAWFIKCVAQAVSEHPEVHAMKRGNRTLILFEDVDIAVPIQKRLNGDLVPMNFVLRKANEKSLQDIHSELEQARLKTVGDDVVLDNRKNQRLLRLTMKMPKFIRMAWWKSVICNPMKAKATMGTVTVTSLAMFGKVNAWGIPISIHPLTFALGPVAKKAGVFRDTVVPREFLNLTILFDHDVIDGGPAARFIARLNGLIETGYGL